MKYACLEILKTPYQEIIKGLEHGYSLEALEKLLSNMTWQYAAR